VTHFLVAQRALTRLNGAMNRQPDSLAPVSHLTRREFIHRTGSVALLGMAAGGERLWADEPRALVGSNSFGWTQYAKRDKKPFDLVGTMSAVRDCGYDYLEPGMDFAHPDSIAKLADQMKSKGLKPVSLYCGPRLHEAEKAKGVVDQLLAAARVCKECGFQVISCNVAPIGREKTDDELKTQVAALKDFGQGLKDLGLKLAVHHHLPEMANHAREFHYNFRNTPADVVGFCYDVHWVWKGGVQPMDALREYGNRVATWHIRQSRDGVWWEDLDTGDIDYAAIARYVAEHGLARRFTVELAIEGKTQITRDVMENHRRSREFIRKVFGA
jgi:inosose dehydratase